MRIRTALSVLLAVSGLIAAPVAVRPGINSAANAFARNMGRGELVGRVVNTASRLTKRRVQVRAGGREWTLHVPSGAAVVNGRREASVHDLDVGTYVRATGERIGKTRLKADHVYVIGDRLALRTSGYARRAGESGYYASYAGYRSRYRR